MSAMQGSAWDALVSAALVGTGRRPVPTTALAAVDAVLGAAPDPATREHGVLTSAAVLGAWRRAGWTAPRHDGAPPEPAPSDERPVPSPRAVQLLELLLADQVPVAGGTRGLTVEWLERCAAGGRRLPHHLLPRVLETATAGAGARTRTPLRTAALAAGGARLRWLASRNPAWAWAADAADTDADVEEVWTTSGIPAERLEALSTVRSADAERGRALLAATWAEESAADRTSFVEALAVGLSPEDEPFLEAALDDRSRGVRSAAAELLARLPSSALAGRMEARLRPLVHVEGRLRRRLEVDSPGEPDAAMVRDGITAAGAPPGVGPRAWILVQLIGATPLRFWEELLGDAEHAIRLAAGSDDLLAGWVLAAGRQANQEWTRHLLAVRADPALLSALPAAVAQAELVRLLPRLDDAAAARVVAATPGPWSDDVSRAVVARLRAATKANAVLQVILVLAERLHPSTAPELEGWAQMPGQPGLGGNLRALAQTMSIRLTIVQELS